MFIQIARMTPDLEEEVNVAIEFFPGRVKRDEWVKQAKELTEVMTNYWLMKSEPHVYSFDDLMKDGSTHWDGVRNYQARNFMRDKMRTWRYCSLLSFQYKATPYCRNF